jgi:beta-glucosidase
VLLIAVQAAAGKGIMCSYNAVNGEPACASSTLLQGMLRQGLGFEGYVVSDCNAVAALTFGQKSAGSLAEAAAASVKAGVDMLCDKPDLVRDALEKSLM